MAAQEWHSSSLSPEPSLVVATRVLVRQHSWNQFGTLFEVFLFAGVTMDGKTNIPHPNWHTHQPRLLQMA
jgi:hypothetical protein